MKDVILIAEDDADMRDLLDEELRLAGYETLVAIDGKTALALLRRAEERIDLIVTDVQMPGLKGDELLRAARELRAEAPVIVITGFGSVAQAVDMMQRGAYQYLTKPFEVKELRRLTAEALEKSETLRQQLRSRREKTAPPPRIIGASRPMRQLFEMISRAAPSGSAVLITGESGSGKELVARALHDQSSRRGDFIALNCAAIPADLIEAELFGHTGGAFTGARGPRAGLFEAANRGTLFLDEIGDLPLAVQPKLLRALQEGAIRRVGADREHQVDVRVIAATNRDLEADVKAGRFREDLFWRLNVIPLRLPALRERPIDIPLLVDHFVSRAAEAENREHPLDVSPEALAILTAYHWPGNVRELENAIQYTVALAKGSIITPEDLPDRIQAAAAATHLLHPPQHHRLPLREVERDYILETLRETGGNKLRTSEILGLDRKTLYRKLEEYREENPQLEL